jgi:hypothetical protein
MPSVSRLPGSRFDCWTIAESGTTLLHQASDSRRVWSVVVADSVPRCRPRLLASGRPAPNSHRNADLRKEDEKLDKEEGLQIRQESGIACLVRQHFRSSSPVRSGRQWVGLDLPFRGRGRWPWAGGPALLRMLHLWSCHPGLDIPRRTEPTGTSRGGPRSRGTSARPSRGPG